MIACMYAGQTYSQLMSMEKDIQRQLAAGEGDPEYWEVRRPGQTLVKRGQTQHLVNFN
jgi:hypothetical protein